MKSFLTISLLVMSQLSIGQALVNDSQKAISEFYDATNPDNTASIGDISAFAYGISMACVEQVQGTQQQKENFCECAKNKIIDNMSKKLSPKEAKEAISGAAHGASPWPYQDIAMSGFDSCAN